MVLRKVFAQVITVMALITVPAIAGNSRVNIQHIVDSKTRIESWQLQDEGVEVLLIQISPDQARGFFLARGFKRVDVDYYASSCVFATVVKNLSPRPISYRLANWRYAKAAGGAARKLKLKEDWLREWKQRGVSQSAQIAFEWSQHPEAQTLEPNDWNQGMTTYQVPHGSRFDLTVKWQIGARKYEDKIRGIRCAD